jgi:hypothetical protein
LWISEHRSISRQIDASHNEIYVSENWANIKSFPYIHLDELIVKVEYIDFLAYTHLLELRPKADLSVSAPGQYRILEEHIDVHRYFMGLDQKREIAYHEAVTDWYDQIYLPVLKVIVEQHCCEIFLISRPQISICGSRNIAILWKNILMNRSRSKQRLRILCIALVRRDRRQFFRVWVRNSLTSSVQGRKRRNVRFSCDRKPTSLSVGRTIFLQTFLCQLMANLMAG